MCQCVFLDSWNVRITVSCWPLQTVSGDHTLAHLHVYLFVFRVWLMWGGAGPGYLYQLALAQVCSTHTTHTITRPGTGAHTWPLTQPGGARHPREGFHESINNQRRNQNEQTEHLDKLHLGILGWQFFGTELASHMHNVPQPRPGHTPHVRCHQCSGPGVSCQ